MSRRVFDVLVYFLGAALLLCIVGVIVLLAIGKPVDDILKQAITGLVTGLLGLMVRAPADADDPQPVHVTNDHADPVPVAEGEATTSSRRPSRRPARS